MTRRTNKNAKQEQRDGRTSQKTFQYPPHDDITIKQKAFHITIVDNSNGNKIVDADTNCICGGYAVDDERSATIGFSKCNVVELCGAVSSAKKATAEMTADNPIAQLMLKLGEQHE